jgi:hypothetical protein
VHGALHLQGCLCWQCLHSAAAEGTHNCCSLSTCATGYGGDQQVCCIPYTKIGILVADSVQYCQCPLVVVSMMNNLSQPLHLHTLNHIGTLLNICPTALSWATLH